MRFAAILSLLPLALAAPILEARADAEVIPNKFIVVMKEDLDDDGFASSLGAVAGILGFHPQQQFNIGTFKGFSVEASSALIQLVSNLASIQFIEPDTIVRTRALTTQNSAPWGLARISHQNKGATSYVYDSSAGAGTVVYGIDTGIYCGHSDFGGRCTFGANFVDKNNTDGNGHGTHTAATMAGSTYGVAKKAQVVAVKVLSAEGSGANSGVISGIQWAADDMVKRGKVNKAVGNLSLGGPRLGSASNRAVAAAVQKGLFMAVAAGNSAAPVALFAPASEPLACTVGASDKNDKFASFSNFGAGVDVIAPGVDITSAWIRNANDKNTISGTSMAAPHVGGLAAYLIALEGSKAPDAVCSRIKSLALKGKISGFGLGGILTPTPNLLAYNGAA